MKRYVFYVLALAGLLIGISSCKKDNITDAGGPSGNDWSLLGDANFSNKVSKFSIAANGGNVYAGYWDASVSKPCVKKYNTATGKWDYYGGGPVDQISNITTDSWVSNSFKFRQEGSNSYICINRSITQPEFIIFKTSGSVWEQLPSVPFDQLPGYTAGYGGFPDQGADFDFDVKQGRLYALVHYDNNTWQSEETSLAVFVYDGGSWTLLPQHIGYGLISGSFSWTASFEEPRIHVSQNGKIYLNYYLRENDVDVKSANVSVYTGGQWSRLTTSTTFRLSDPSTVTYKYGFHIYGQGTTDHLITNPSDVSAAPLLVYDGAFWSQLANPGPSQKSVSTVNTTCAECLYARVLETTGVAVKKYANGSWQYVGTKGFISGASGTLYGEDEIVYDNGYLYVIVSHNSSTSVDQKLSVYKYKL
jgi:hypothetical protein